MRITLGKGKYSITTMRVGDEVLVEVNRLTQACPIGGYPPPNHIGKTKLVLACLDERAVDVWIWALQNAKRALRGEPMPPPSEFQ